ncbi:MAG TPA: PIN domain-containing protein [Pyrinomonadaceae bacterium]|nr:PIN domain-containing protein [Pyrinomonadaceae bacterium]
MNKVFLDTSFMIALINDKDQYHEKAREILPIYIRDYLVITDAVLLEIGNALARDYRNEAFEIIKTLRNSNKTEVVEINHILFEKGLELYGKFSDKNWGLVDCISFVVMKENNITDALTSDKHFAQAGFRAQMLDSVN